MDIDEREEGLVQTRSPNRRLVTVAVIVALSAAIACGSCSAISTGSIVLPALLSAVIALAITVLYFCSVGRCREVNSYATITLAAYIVGVSGSWWPLLYISVRASIAGTVGEFSPLLLMPSGVIALIVIAGGLFAGRMVKNDTGGFSWLAVLTFSVAIVIAAFGFVTGFWVFLDLRICFFDECGTTTLNAIPFAAIAGAVPPICAAGALWLCGKVYR